MRCKHNIEKAQCAYCNGDYDRQETFRVKRKRYNEDVRRLCRQYLAMALDGLENWGEHWDDEDIDLILSTEVNLKNRYELAIELERSLKAVHFIQIYAFGKNVIPKNNNYYKQIQNRKAALGMKNKFLRRFNHITLEQTLKRKG